MSHYGSKVKDMLYKSLLDIAESQIPKIYRALSSSRDVIARRIEKILENPENLYLATYPKTPYKYIIIENTKRRIWCVGVSVSFLVNDVEEYYIVLYPILWTLVEHPTIKNRIVDAKNRILARILLHELAHVAKYGDELVVESFEEEMSNLAPDVFVTTEEYNLAQHVLYTLRLPMEEICFWGDLLDYFKYAPAHYRSELLKYAKKLPPVKSKL